MLTPGLDLQLFCVTEDEVSGYTHGDIMKVAAFWVKQFKLIDREAVKKESE